MYLFYSFLSLEKQLQIAASFSSRFISLTNNLTYKSANYCQSMKELWASQAPPLLNVSLLVHHF